MLSPEPVEGSKHPALRFAGYAALFDKRDAGRDIIRPGAFARTLAEWSGKVPLLWQHRADLRIGWVETLGEDARGLRVIASLDNPDSAAGLALKSGSVTGLSFGYRARNSQSSSEGRELREVDLFEVSLVTHPMQHRARVHLIAPSSSEEGVGGGAGPTTESRFASDACRIATTPAPLL